MGSRVSLVVVALALLLPALASAQQPAVEVEQVPVATDPGATPGEAAPASASASAPAPGDQALKLKELENRVNQLKERIHQSKARLIQLQEVVLHGTISGSKALLLHSNQLGSSFRIESVQYSLDGSPIYNRTDQDGDLDQSEELTIFDGSIVPGNHHISAYVVLRGSGYGIFSYLNNYRFKVKSSFTFTAEEGKQTTVKVVLFEKGDLTTELAERPSIRFDVERKRAMRVEDLKPQEGGGSAQ